MIGWWPGHNFSVVARSLLISTINLGLPRDFNELRVAKISRFATSALTAGKQPLDCMGRADLCVSGGTASISFYTTLCSSYLRCRRSNQAPAAGGHLLNSPKNANCRTPVLDQALIAAERQRLVVSLAGSSVPTEVDDSTALSLSSLDRLRVSRLLPPRSGLERSDFVRWRKADVLKASPNVRFWA
jgi:hypothetical protein